MFASPPRMPVGLCSARLFVCLFVGSSAARFATLMAKTWPTDERDEAGGAEARGKGGGESRVALLFSSYPRAVNECHK